MHRTTLHSILTSLVAFTSVTESPVRSGAATPQGASGQFYSTAAGGPQQPSAAPPPLPPGPPPPSSSAAGGAQYSGYPGYSAYGTAPTTSAAGPQHAASHPQYPGYGYGAQAATTQAAPYGGYQANPAYPQPSPAAPYSYPQAGQTPVNAASYASYYGQPQAPYPGYAQGAVPSQPPLPVGPPPSSYPPSHAPYGSPAGPAAPQPYPGGAGFPPNAGLPSPQGAPPYKRTRYDSLGSSGPGGPMGPPPALPPVGRPGRDRGPPLPPRGGPPPYDRYDDRPPPPGPPYRDDGYGVDSPDRMHYRRDGPGPMSRGPPRGERAYDSRAPMPPPSSSGRHASSNYSRGPPPERYSSGERGPRGGERSSRGGGRGGRPVSGLPGRGGYSSGRRESDHGRRSGGGPNAGITPFEAAKAPRNAGKKDHKKERKWGSKGGSGGDAVNGKDEPKHTLTDFRISGLSIAEIEWSWQTEKVKAAVKALVDTQEVKEAHVDGDETPQSDIADMSIDDAAAPVDTTPSTPAGSKPAKKSKKQRKAEAKRVAAAAAAAAAAASVEQDEKQTSDAAESTAGHTTDVATTADSASTSVARKDGKHGRDEDDTDVEPTDDIAAKKARADTGETVVVADAAPEEVHSAPTESVLQKDSLEQDVNVKVEVESETVTSSSIARAASLPPKPVTASAATSPGKSASIASRENSRLRIYFSSPVSPAVGHVSAPKVEETTKNSQPAVKTSDLDHKSESAQSHEAQSTRGKTEETEDVDGADVDGEPLPGDDETQGSDDDGDDADEVQTSLLAREPAATSADDKASDGIEGAEADGPAEDQEVVTAATVKAEDRDESIPTAQSVEIDNASYPPDPYAQGPQTLAATAPSVAESDAGTDARATSLAPSELNGPAFVPPEPSADRISISYARNTRRMVLDAEVVEKVRIFRSESRIELSVAVRPALQQISGAEALDEYRICQGVIIEALDPESDEYILIDRASLERSWNGRSQATPADDDKDEPVERDTLLPPLHQLIVDATSDEQAEGITVVPTFSPDHITVVATMDRANPLTEARWVKTGEVEQWILSLALANGSDIKKEEQLSAWRGKIEVVDPEPSPTIQHALDSWASSSTVSSLEERKKFVTTHMSNIDNVLEILLRLTRGGDRTGPASNSGGPSSSTQAPPVGVLAATLAAPYPDSQTQVSLAVLAMFRLSVQTAEKAGLDTKEIHRQVADIVRTVPYPLQYRALDGMFKEYRAAGKK